MKSHDPSRRQWLTGLLRGSLLSLIAAVCALLIGRSSGERSVRCAQRLTCERCGSLPGCRLPPAVAWRQR
jgi:hypothetical protein